MTLKNSCVKLAVSNLAWNFEENEEVFSILKTIGIDYIEGVITKISSWENINNEILLNYSKYLFSKKIKLMSLQSIFFNTIITNFKEKENVLKHIDKLIEISKILKIKILVFGSPKMRIKYDNWQEDLNNIFKDIDIKLEGTDIKLCIEPNASIYGGEYFFKLSEIINFIDVNKFKNIKTMIDTHNAEIEGEDLIKLFDDYFEYIYHIHISEKGLKALEDKSLHFEFSKKIKTSKYSGIITYEVFKHNNFIDSLKLFHSIYN